MTLPGFEARQVAFSYAYAFSDKIFSFGVTGKIIQGASYNGSMTLKGGTEFQLRTTLEKPALDRLWNRRGCYLSPILMAALWPGGERHQSTDL